jgi:chaperonin GroES
MKIQPLGERVLIEPMKAETKTASGIIIPDTAKEKPSRGTVKAVGKTTDGKELDVKIGDTVLYGKFAGTEVELDSESYLIMEQADILAII